MKAIVLTGATGGLGQSLAEILADEADTQLICLYRNPSKFDRLFREYKGCFMGYHVREDDSFEELTEHLNSDGLDQVILVLNAFSIVPIKRVGDFLPEEVEAFIHGNLTGNILLLNRIIGHCKRHAMRLRVIHIDSGAADRPLTGWSNYCAGKAYMNAFLSVVSAENPAFEIVSFDPGIMDTGMQAEIRAVKSEVFDQVDAFIGYKEENKLRAPSVVAKQIKERYITQWTAGRFREKIV